jgi:flagellar assembly protein FliH
VPQTGSGNAATATFDFALPALEPVPGLVDDGSRSPAAAAAAASEAVLAAARAEADAIREQARAAGHAEGLATGREAVEHAVAALRSAADGLGEVAGELPGALEEQAVELGLAIAEQVLGGALEARPELVVDVVRGGLRRLVERERVTLLVHPDDLDCVRAAAPALQAELGGIEHCEVQAERRVARGGAMVRTADGEIDATIETKLSRVREIIVQSLTAPSPDAGEAGADAHDDVFGG